MANTVFFLGKRGNARTYPRIGVGNVARTNIHHASRLEGIELQMKIDKSERVRRTVEIGEELLSLEAMRSHIQFHVHFIVNRLLPLGRLRRSNSGEAKKENELHILIFANVKKKSAMTNQWRFLKEFSLE